VSLNVSETSTQYIKDIATLASWGVGEIIQQQEDSITTIIADALKVDGCNMDKKLMSMAYPKVSKAINQTGRAMWYSCSWPCYTGVCSIFIIGISTMRLLIL
jgi:hypothetical protein